MAQLNRRKRMLSSRSDHDYVGNVLGVVAFSTAKAVDATGLVVLYKDKSTLYLRYDGEFLNMADLSTESMKSMKIVGGLYKGPPNLGGSSQSGGRNVAQLKDMLFK